jgi:toxin ParE1/3/4
LENYELSAEAQNDIDQIYLYSFENFGEQQADQYFLELHTQLDVISEAPLRYPEIMPPYRRCVFQSHDIYFRLEDGLLLIVRILGQQNLDLIFH